MASRNQKQVIKTQPVDIQRYNESPVSATNPVDVDIINPATGETPVSVANGSDKTQGATSDAIVAAGAVGTISAKLRRLTSDIGDLLTAITGTIKTYSYFRTGASTFQIPVMDANTHVLLGIDVAHSKIHSGDSFYRKDWLDLTNGQVYDILCVTPDTARYAHIVVEFASELESNIKVYEGATASNNGTAITVFNRNRNSATNSTTLLYHTPTVAGGAEGMNIANYKIGSSRAVGGNEGSRLEIILKRNTKYLIRITNDTANANWFAFLADWYEHTNLTA